MTVDFLPAASGNYQLSTSQLSIISRQIIARLQLNN